MSHGLTVTRILLDAETGQLVTTPKLGQLLKIQLTLETPRVRRQIAVQDFLPAGLEPIDTALRTSGSHGDDQVAGYWSHRELHDERVTFFANYLSAGKHEASFLARATRAGTFVRPAPRAEAMYDPDVFGVGAIETVRVEP
jgi:hypothetical protein